MPDFADDPLGDIQPEVIARFSLDQLPFGRAEQSTPELLSLAGKRAIVTGGGGDGLGNATCHRLAEQGADVAVFDVSEAHAHATANAVASRFGFRTSAHVVDVGNARHVSAAVDRVVHDWGGVDLVVNNAGGSGAVGEAGRKVQHHGSFVAMDDDEIANIVRVNLLGVMRVTKAALPHMIDAGHGRIINVASEGGKISVDGLVTYASAKAGVIGFTRNIAREVGRLGVSVVCVCPGIMVSQRTLNTMASATSAGLASLANGFDRVTIGRCSLADEVASVIAFLASPAGAYVHATAVSVGGGMAD